MAINLIDPNDVISSIKDITNGMPNYSDMFIFVELYVITRGKTVIVSGGKSNVVENVTEGVKINMLGFDQDQNEHTTKWTETVDGTVKPYEGFGLTNIKFVTNSSYVPMVYIEFKDIKGLSLFNLGKDSPYSVLHDFPPPLFKLTVKGFYGKALTYDLHLLKQYTRFDGETGNYITSAEFTARTFAPLSDVLWKYIEVFPFINKNNSTTTNPNINDEPKSSKDLIIKFQNLYSSLKDYIDESKETKIIETIKKRKESFDLVISYINLFKNRIDSSIQNNCKILIETQEKKISDDNYKTIETNSITYYDQFLKNNVDDVDSKLYLAILNSNEQSKQSIIEDSINKEKENIKKEINYKNLKIDFKDTDIVVDEIDVMKGENVETYNVLNITNLYRKIYYIYNSFNRELEEAENKLREDLNEIAKLKLGGIVPNIYNIFEIIANDVDMFFEILRQTVKSAEEHHEKYESLIRTENNGIQEKKNKIKAFPLYIKNSTYGRSTDKNNATQFNRKERAYPGDPGELGVSLPETFPEVLLVEDFIKAYVGIEKERTINSLKTAEDESGNKKWIPFSPIDSKLGNSINYDSPYLNINKVPKDIYKVMLNRFYATSQFSYGKSFYYAKDKKIRKNLIKFIAGSEAVNIVNSLINEEKLIDSLSEGAKIYKTNPSLFYEFINKEIPETSIKLLQHTIDIENNTLFRRRTHEQFNGFKILDRKVEFRVENSNMTQDVVDIYMEDPNSENFLKTIWKYLFSTDDGFEFTKENILYMTDIDRGNYYNTHFLKSSGLIVGGAKIILVQLMDSRDLILDFLEGRVNDKLKNVYSEEVKAFVILSFFGYTQSFFSEINNVAEKFKLPSVLTIPDFVIKYMGALCNYRIFGDYMDEIDKLLDEDFADSLHIKPLKKTIKKESDYIGLMSLSDKLELIEEFKGFVDDVFPHIKNSFISLINDVNNIEGDDIVELNKKRGLFIEDGLSKNGEYSVSIMEELFSEKLFLNYSDMTFNIGKEGELDTNPDDGVDNGINFFSLDIGNKSSSLIKESNDLYFGEFFKQLDVFLEKRKKEIEKIDQKFDSILNDSDIKNQCYYSFKSIADRWIVGMDNKNNKGFPLNEKNENGSYRLIDRFKFVDRAYNNIGNDSIINIESLLDDLSSDLDKSVLTVISTILSLNGYEFFPLQNFISFNEGEWENSFKMHQNVNHEASPAFICMYIGGTSSTLNNEISDYDDDGIENFETDIITDFATITDENDPFSKVRAFRVRFGEQNQSIFTNIKFDTREHQETNESLSILSKIAQDESVSTPVPKGQNLYNTYENRSYTATVSMLGNFSIQPTQYFQIENCPLFNGAYIILNVEHEIGENNQITTTFQGVRVVKYPVPIVRDFATSIGLLGGTSGSSIRTIEVNGKTDNKIPTNAVIYEDMNNIKIIL